MGHKLNQLPTLQRARIDDRRVSGAIPAGFKSIGLLQSIGDTNRGITLSCPKQTHSRSYLHVVMVEVSGVRQIEQRRNPKQLDWGHPGTFYLEESLSVARTGGLVEMRSMRAVR